MSVVGVTGIGKSRLAWELSKYADGLVEDTWWHVGRCPAYGDGIAFWALGEMIRQRAGLLETDDEATTRSRIGATVREWITDEAEQRRVEPALLALLGIETGAAAPEQLFGAGGRSSSGSPVGARSSSSSRISTRPTRACWRSSTTSWSGAARFRSSS